MITILEASEDYWRSPEGLRRRAAMMGEDFVFRFVNQAIQVYGTRNEIYGFMWVGSMDERTCDQCDAGIGRIFRLGQFMPNLPLHAGCRCSLELYPREG